MRLRKEYLYRKSLEGKEKESFERKKRIKDAMAGASDKPVPVPQAIQCYPFAAAGKALPTETRKEASSLIHEIEMEDDVHAAPKVRDDGLRILSVSSKFHSCCRHTSMTSMGTLDLLTPEYALQLLAIHLAV